MKNHYKVSLIVKMGDSEEDMVDIDLDNIAAADSKAAADIARDFFDWSESVNVVNVAPQTAEAEGRG